MDQVSDDYKQCLMINIDKHGKKNANARDWQPKQIRCVRDFWNYTVESISGMTLSEFSGKCAIFF